MNTSISGVLLLLIVAANSESVLSPGDGHWGKWTEWSMCLKSSYARGFRLRFEPKQGLTYDDSGLNAVQIKCEDLYGSETSTLKPHDGFTGDWSQLSGTTCKKGFINGVAIEIYGTDGWDARGATNLKMRCNDGSILERSNDDKKGTWGEIKHCSQNMAICGIKVRMGDSKTALNGAKFKCCDLPSNDAYPFNLPVLTTRTPAISSPESAKPNIPINSRTGLSGDSGCKVPNLDNARIFVIKNCKCSEFSETCQLIQSGPFGSGGGCKPFADDSCRNAVVAFAGIFKNAKNANDPECKDKDRRYKSALETWANCSKGNNEVIFPDSPHRDGDATYNNIKNNSDTNDGNPIPRTNSGEDNSEEIIGITVGIILFLVIIALIVMLIIKKRNKKGDEIMQEVNLRYEVEDAEEKINMIRPESFLR